MIVRTDDVWWPLLLSKFILGDQPVPFRAWLSWHHDHAKAIEQNKRATDPFPDGVLT